MKRGFVFMLDAFIALMIVIAFVSSLGQFSRDYSYIQDETLYSYGRGMMNILLYKTVEVDVSTTIPTEKRQVPLVHALSTSDGQKVMDEVDKLIPPQYDYSIDYYFVDDKYPAGTGWKMLYERNTKGKIIQKAVAVVSTVPTIYSNENYSTPYTYGTFCGSPDGANRCLSPTDLYSPDEFGSYDKAFVRVVVKI